MPQAAAGMRIDPPVSVPIARCPCPSRPRLPAAAGSAGRPLCIARMPDRPKCRTSLVVPSELVQVRAADEDDAGVAQVRDDWRVAIGGTRIEHA